MKTSNSSRTVVSASVSRSPRQTSTAAIEAVKMIATHGVRRPGWTLPRTPGTTFSLAIPYISRLAITRFSRQPLISANRAIAEKTLLLTANGPWVTTSSSGPSDSASVSAGTAMPATIVTSR